MISFKTMSINNFIYGRRLMFDCHRVSVKAPEELLFLKMISRVLGAIAFDDVSSIFRIWTDLESAAVQCYQEFL